MTLQSELFEDLPEQTGVADMRLLIAAITLCWTTLAFGQNGVVPGTEFVFGNASFPGASTDRTGPVNTSTDYVAVARLFPQQISQSPFGGNTPVDVLTTNFTYLPLSTLLNQSPSGQIQSQIADLASRLDAVQISYNKLAEGIALASAMTVLPPNPGDRFFVSVTGAGFSSYAAGAINFSARLSDSALAYGGYARSQNQNLVKGGVGWSFR